MLIISKITHKKNPLNRKLHSNDEVGSLCKLKTINDFAYSRTHNSWYLPYTKESFQQLKTLFPELKIIASTGKKNKIALATIAKAKNINPLDRILTQKNENKNEKPP